MMVAALRHLVASGVLVAAAVASGESSLAPRQLPFYSDGPVDCTDSSFLGPKWYLFDPVYTLVNYTTGGRIGDVAMTVINLSANITTQCHSRSIDMFGGVEWHACNSSSLFFQIDLGAEKMSFKETWSCERTPA